MLFSLMANLEISIHAQNQVFLFSPPLFRKIQSLKNVTCNEFAGTYKLTVQYGKTYLVRMVNAAMSNILFFAIAKHKITVVGTDGSYTKPLKTDYITISPGQTIDFLLEANQSPYFQYYIATKAYNTDPSSSSSDNTTATAIIQYQPTSNSVPIFPNNLLPNYYNSSTVLTNFTSSLRSLASQRHPVNVPLKVNTHLFFTVSLNTFPCTNKNSTCDGPDGRRLAASVNNISFASRDISVLEAYYYNIKGIYGDKFPSYPPMYFNFTGDDLPVELQMANRNTTVKVLEYNSTVELVLQGTNLVAGTEHPMHLHGHNFYVVGWGLGNFNNKTDPLKYNLVDPPQQNTIAVPKNGWVAIRFLANNPGNY